jgi:hypothetical protein
MQKKYSSIYRINREQPLSDVFAYFPNHRTTGETWLDQTAELAESEGWDFAVSDDDDEPVKRHKALARYINFIFLTAQEQGRLKYSEDRMRACLNTNLRTPFGQQLFLSFFKNRFANSGQYSNYVFFGAFPETSYRLKDFHPLPEPVSFVEDFSSVAFNPAFDLVINAEHIIIDNARRLPDVLADNQHLAFTAITGAITLLKERLKEKILRLAVPMLYRDRVQQLLPLNLTNSSKPDLALVADPDADSKVYHVRTALPLKHAYIRARLLTPDVGWLKSAVV